MKENAPAQKEL